MMTSASSTAADENRAFIDCVRDGTQPSCNFRDAAKTYALINQIYAAAGKTV